MKFKLVMVSIVYKGRRITKFVQARQIENKSVIDQEVISTMLKEAGCVNRGSTWTMGG